MIFEQNRIEDEIVSVKHKIDALDETIMPEAKADDIARRDGVTHRLVLFSQITERLKQLVRELEAKSIRLRKESDAMICRCL